jgi:protein SCO1/2
MSRIAIGALSLILALAACRATAVEGMPEASATARITASEEGGVLPRSDRSIYAQSMSLTDEDGDVVGLDVFRGQPVFIGMFYGSCPTMCPLLISTIHRAMSELDASTDAEVRVLLVSFDPERDSPTALHAIVAKRKLDARWKLTSAPDDQARELAALLGIQYRKLPDGSFTHTSSIVLLDRAGAIDMRLDDMTQPVDPLVARARALAASR